MKFKKRNWSNLSLLFKTIKTVCPFRVAYSLINIALEKTNNILFSVLIVKYIVENFEHGLSTHKIINIFIVAGLFQLTTKLVGSYYYNIYVPKTNLKIEQYIREKIYNKAIQVDIKNYDSPEIYKKFTLAMSDSSEHIIQLYELFVSLIGSIYMVVTIGIIMLTINPIFVVFVLTPLLVNLVIGKKFNRLHYKYNNEKIQNQRIRNYVNRCFFYKEYTLDQKTTEIHNSLINHFRKSTTDLLEIIRKNSGSIAFFEYIYMVTSDVFVYLGCIMFSVFGIYAWDLMSVADCIVVINTLNNMIGALWQLGSLYVKMDKNLLFLENYTDFLKLSNDIVDGGGSIKNECASIIFKNVSFSYPNEKNSVLQNLNFEIRYGQKLAIVGINGIGKTTLIKLILRLYDPTNGEVIFDGKNIKQYITTEYRKKFNVLFQDYQLYSFTLAANISMDEKTDEVSAQNSLLKTSLDKKIKEVSNPLDWIVGNEIDSNGLQFSKGEKQKLALARLFYKKKKYIILDEPFSNLDPITEKSIYDNLMNEFRDETLIAISHRLPSISAFDKIMLIDSGHVAEYGNHDELMKAKGIYYMMYNKQMEMFKDGEESE